MNVISDNFYSKFNNEILDLKTGRINKRGKSWIRIGYMEKSDGGIGVQIESNAKFNWFQKKMWKFLLNIDIEDIK